MSVSKMWTLNSLCWVCSVGFSEALDGWPNLDGKVAPFDRLRKRLRLGSMERRADAHVNGQRKLAALSGPPRPQADLKLRIVAVDKIREPYIAEAVADFRTRLRHYESLDEIEVPVSRGVDPARAVRDESDRILAALQPADVLWLLDREGTELSSTALAERLRAQADNATTRLVLAIGGAYGVDERVKARAAFRWSLSRLTFLHEWARALVLEQLYRAAKIARNEPYHH